MMFLACAGDEDVRLGAISALKRSDTSKSDVRKRDRVRVHVIVDL